MKQLKYLLLVVLCLVILDLNSFAQCGIRFVENIFEEDEILLVQGGFYGYYTYENILENTITQAYDVYMPNPTIDPILERPLVVLAHGGSFINGSKEKKNIVRVAKYLVRKGYVVALINYRLINQQEAMNLLTPNSTVEERTNVFVPVLREAVCDMRAAIHYFLEETVTETENLYGIDPNQVVVGGSSAGAIVALHTAYLSDENGLASYPIVDLNNFVEGTEDCFFDQIEKELPIKAVLNFTGALLTSDVMQEGETPVISVHEEKDFVIPCEADTMALVNFNNLIDVDWISALDSLNLNDLLGLKLLFLEGGCAIHEQANALNIPNHFSLLEGNNGHVYYLRNNNNVALHCDWAATHLAKYIDYPYHIIYESTDFNDNLDFNTPDTLCGIYQDTLVYSWLTGLEETALENIQVYPNPTNDFLQIELMEEINNPFSINLFDVNGRLIKSISENTSKSVSLEVLGLSSGIYTLKIQTEDGSFFKKVFID